MVHRASACPDSHAEFGIGNSVADPSTRREFGIKEETTPNSEIRNPNSQACYRFEVYPITIRRRLPRIRVPLRAPDPDIVLPLQAVFVRCYDSGGYEDFVDYNAEPPVPLAPDDALFSDALLCEAQRRAKS